MGIIAVGSSSLLEAARTGAWLDAVLGVLLPGVPAHARAPLHTLLRKLGHVVEYGVLAVLWQRALAPVRRAGGWAFLLATGYAVVDELSQALTPTRGPAALDVVLDAVGAGLGLAAWAGRSGLLAATAAAAAVLLALAAGLGLAFLLLDRVLGRPAGDLVLATPVLALAAWGMARAAAAWRNRP